MMVRCALCSGRGDSETPGWTSDGTSWWDPGCGQLERGDTWAVDVSVLPHVAAARSLIRWCDEVDQLFERLSGDEAGREAQGRRDRIRDVGRSLGAQEGPAGMRKVLDLVAVDGDPGQLMGLNIVGPGGGRMSLATPIPPERRVALGSHARYVEREWTGVGAWAG